MWVDIVLLLLAYLASCYAISYPNIPNSLRVFSQAIQFTSSIKFVNSTRKNKLKCTLRNYISFSERSLKWQIKALWVHIYFTTKFRTDDAVSKQTTAALQKTLLTTSGLVGSSLNSFVIAFDFPSYENKEIGAFLPRPFNRFSTRRSPKRWEDKKHAQNSITV